MLSKRRCPHTGVVNYFFTTEPHLAVASVIKGAQAGYLWRCYADHVRLAGARTIDRGGAPGRRVCHRVARNDASRWFDAA